MKHASLILQGLDLSSRYFLKHSKIDISANLRVPVPGLPGELPISLDAGGREESY